MERKKASDLPQALLDLFDAYVHGGISRRAFLDGARKFAIGGLTATALFDMLRPNYAWAVQVPPDDPRITARTATVGSPKGTGTIKGYLVRPATSEKLPGVIVVHENRGLNPYTEDLARRLALANFIAFAPDGLTSVGGYPGDDEKGLTLFKTVDPDKMFADFLAAAQGSAGLHGKNRRGRLLLRRRRRQSARCRDGRGAIGRRPLLRDAAEGGGGGEDQGPAQRPIRRPRSAHHLGLAGLRRGADRGPRPTRRSHL